MATSRALLALLLALFSSNLFTAQAFFLPYARPNYDYKIRSSSSPKRTARETLSTPVVSSRSSMSSSANNESELPDDATLTSLLDVAIRASKQAGEIILGNAGGADVLKSKANSRDLLTLVDPLCEKVRY